MGMEVPLAGETFCRRLVRGIPFVMLEASRNFLVFRVSSFFGS